MANTVITMELVSTGQTPKVEFKSTGNFSLGGDFTACYKERTFDSLNFESIGMTTNGATVTITTTSGKYVEFIAMPLASMTGVETAVTNIFGTDIEVGGGTQAEWNEQLYDILESQLNWRH